MPKLGLGNTTQPPPPGASYRQRREYALGTTLEEYRDLRKEQRENLISFVQTTHKLSRADATKYVDDTHLHIQRGATQATINRALKNLGAPDRAIRSLTAYGAIENGQSPDWL